MSTDIEYTIREQLMQVVQSLKADAQFSEAYTYFTRYVDQDKLDCFRDGAKTAFEDNFAEYLLAKTTVPLDGYSDSFQWYLRDLNNSHLNLYRVARLRGNDIELEDAFSHEKITAEYRLSLPRLQKKEVCGLRVLGTENKYVGFSIYRFLPMMQKKIIPQIIKDCEISIGKGVSDGERVTKIKEDYIIHSWMTMTAEIEKRLPK